jgi:hypothetical protein
LNLAAEIISLKNVPEQRLDQNINNLAYGMSVLVVIYLHLKCAFTFEGGSVEPSAASKA